MKIVSLLVILLGSILLMSCYSLHDTWVKGMSSRIGDTVIIAEDGLARLRLKGSSYYPAYISNKAPYEQKNYPMEILKPLMLLKQLM